MYPANDNKKCMAVKHNNGIINVILKKLNFFNKVHRINACKYREDKDILY